MNDLVFRSAASMAAAIRSREISSRELMDAHLEHIERVNPPLNAVVRVLGERARAEARAADEALARGEAKGPFHGVPMSVKDAWEVAGVPSTGGTLGRANYIASRDATVIARMRAAGAIPIAMTNLPEMSFAFESDNLVHGRANNPHNVARTCGGSGGGGAAAVAAGMSPLEIGADLGGSIRWPSHCCGIAGIRGTTGRSPMTGYFPPSLGWIRMFTDAGPMARTVEDLELALPVIAGPDWIDATAQEVPLRDPRAIGIKGLRVALHTDNGIMPARADVAAVVKQAAKALEEAGAVVEEKIPTGIDQCFNLFLAIATADGGDGMRAALALAGTTKVHPLLEGFFGMANDRKSAAVFEGLLIGVDRYRSAMLGFLQNYDLIVCPVNALPAMEHGTSPNLFPAFSYTIAHNLTGWPGATVRCGTSEEGLPIGVQCVARPWREDVALAAAKHLEVALGGYQRPALAAAV
ncbi:MAG TPA: amidase [Bryobacteraceae bacterium]|nr:amidase [Bryobacteraceae bacterium]